MFWAACTLANFGLLRLAEFSCQSRKFCAWSAFGCFGHGHWLSNGSFLLAPSYKSFQDWSFSQGLLHSYQQRGLPSLRHSRFDGLSVECCRPVYLALTPDNNRQLVQNIEQSYVALDKNQKLKDFKESGTVDFEKLNQWCSSIGVKQDEHAAALKPRNAEKHEKLRMKDLYLEAYSRRENIKFSNITEFTPGDPRGEDTEQVLRIFLEEEMGYADARTVEIQRIHRLGKKRYCWAATNTATFSVL